MDASYNLLSKLSRFTKISHSSLTRTIRDVPYWGTDPLLEMLPHPNIKQLEWPVCCVVMDMS